MMKSLLRSLAFALATGFGLALPASASTFSVDYTDLWFNPAENGWGLNLIQQNNVIFATMFVYGGDNTPRWYVASDLESSNGTSFSGTLFKTTGSYFGAAWSPAQSTAIATGSMSIVFNSLTSATVTYTADGVTVTKTLQRQTWKGENLTGNYLGGLTANASSCNNGSNGGIVIFGNSTYPNVTVSHNGSSQAVTITLNAPSASGTASVCTFTGTYGQQGKLGSISGNWSCTIGGAPYNSGTFTLSELQATVRGFNARFTGQDQFCQYAGNFGTVRDIQ
jgi:hypothetical protein